MPGGGRQVLRGPGHGGGLAGLHSNPHQLTEDCRLRHSSRIRGLPHGRLPTMAVSALSARSNLFCRFKAVLTASSRLSSSSWSNHTSDRVEGGLGYGETRTTNYIISVFACYVIFNQTTSIQVNEELCYGTTLGLQSSPPEEPCQLAHSLIRLVRFSSFLSRVPHSSSSSGFGGGATSASSWDRGLVGRLVLIVLKCVALTTREARVESSSGESDSSLSSRLVPSFMVWFDSSALS